jgi:hypothetical protein
MVAVQKALQSIIRKNGSLGRRGIASGFGVGSGVGLAGRDDRVIVLFRSDNVGVFIRIPPVEQALID